MRKSLYTLPLLCFGLLAGSQLFAQNKIAELKPDTDPHGAIDGIPGIGNVLTADLNDEFSLIDDHDKPLQLPSKAGYNAGDGTCGFCGSDDTDENLDLNGSSKFIWDGNYGVYPVPASEGFFIRGGQYLVNASLYGMDGRLIRNIAPTAAEIPAQDLAPGVYILRMDTGSELLTQRVVIQ